MRITSCHIGAFGQLSDRRFDDLDHPIVVVTGPNEAGKSTYFSFLESMLYGIYPTDPMKHEYAPQSGRRIEGSLTIRASDDTRYSVSRKLQSAPLGQLVKASGTIDLRNQTLPFISHISHDIFKAVYALTLYDLAALSDAKAWQHIQDRLLGSLSIDYIRSAHDVIGELEDEASSLWRDDRRGKPASKELQKRIRELRDFAKAAHERDRAARAISARIGVLECELKKLRDERIGLEAKKRKIEKLRPLRSRLAKIQEALRDAGCPSDIADLPDDPAARLRYLADMIRERNAELEQVVKDLEAARSMETSLTERDRLLLDEAEQIRSWSKRVESHLGQVNRLEESRRSLELAEAKVNVRASLLLSEPWNAAVGEPLERISLAELRQRMKAYADAQAKLSAEEARRSAIQESVGVRVSVAARAVPAVLLVALGIAATALQSYSIAVAAWLVALGLSLWTWEAKKQNERLRQFADSDRTAELENELISRREKVGSLLQGIPIPSERMERPDLNLTSDLVSLQEAYRKQIEIKELVTDLEEAVESERKWWERLLERIGEESEGQDVALVATRLERAVKEAEQRERDAAAAAVDATRLEKARQQCREDRDGLEEEQNLLLDDLRRIGHGDKDSGIEVYIRRKNALRKAESFSEDLERDFPELERLREEIEEINRSDERWDSSDEEMVGLHHRLDDIFEQTSRKEKELSAAEKELEHLLEKPTIDQIESEREELQSEMYEVATRRDRLMLLGNIIREANRKFREEHQPDVLRRAGKYLQQITDGRYQRLEIEEATDTLHVFEAGSNFGIPCGAPLSQGTRDQIYLAVRLAIVDHLDEGLERLPVFLDEVFVNWDRARRNRFYSVLEEAASRRQFFIFTCHPWLPAELRSQVSAGIVCLGSEAVVV